MKRSCPVILFILMVASVAAHATYRNCVSISSGIPTYLVSTDSLKNSFEVAGGAGTDITSLEVSEIQGTWNLVGIGTRNGDAIALYFELENSSGTNYRMQQGVDIGSCVSDGCESNICRKDVATGYCKCSGFDSGCVGDGPYPTLAFSWLLI